MTSPLVHTNDPEPLRAFAEDLSGHDSKTMAAYVSTVRQFITWLAPQPGGTPFRLSLLTETMIESYLHHLEEQNRAPATRAKTLSALKRFGRWAVGAGRLDRNPATALPRPIVPSMDPTELTRDQRIILKRLVEQQSSPRLSAIFALGYWAGLRRGEVATLRRDHCVLTPRTGTITIVGAKGGKTRTLDLHNAARHPLYDYLHLPATMSEAREPDSLYVFTSQRAAWLRQQHRPDHLTSRGINHLWSALKRQATRQEWEHIQALTFHDLRHDFAHRARAAGWSLEELAVYLGHQTEDGMPAIHSTVRYTLPTRQQLKERLRQMKG
jgi:site-specific recombinase XerD